MTTHNPRIELMSAMNGEVGVNLAGEHKPDLIMVDLNLPGIDGYQVLEKLKEQEETHDIPTVAVSANAMPREIEKGIAAGFDDYLTKPIDVKTFLHIIQNHIYNA